MTVMFAILTAALWLRPLDYAYWAVGMTTALPLLLGYFGQNATDLLPTRLAAIALGAALSIGVAWWLLPVGGRTGGPTVQHRQRATRQAQTAR
ncbi:hypothetical protein [Streptomyces fodineus]|uniref:hypothetical protein n=1 Tax=Streptomyces fodineus TaxID=1904616 RepID=UPI00131D8CCF|nr:hypothetical protein [Streptomyces fodineus]